MFLDVVPALLIMTPVSLPLVKMAGVDSLHCVFLGVLNLVIGLATPPVGMCLLVGANISPLSIEKISKVLIPFLVAVLSVILIVTYWKSAVLWIQRIFGLHD